MSAMTFERVVPAGLNAYFPFQMSAASLNPTATVYQADDGAGADPTLSTGVSVQDLGGGLYALKVLAANMTADSVYYGVVTSGNESVRIPMWAYAPANHIAQVLSDVATVDGVVDGIASEIGDVSTQTFTGISAPATVAAALATIFNKVDGVQSDLDNATDGLGALKTLIENETTAIDSALTTIDNEVGALQGDVTAILADTNELQGDWANGGRLDLLLDRTVAASEAAEDLIGLASDTSASATVFGKIAGLSADVATVDGNVDSIKASVENATYGLSAIEAKVMTVDTVVDGIASALADGTTGLAALKAEIDANESKIDTIDGVVDGIASEIGDVSAVFGGATPPATVAAALKVIYDAQQSAADVWDDAIDGTDPAGSAGKRLYDLSQDLADGGRLDLILDATKLAAENAEDLIGLASDTSASATLFGKIAGVQADTDDIQSKLGAPVGATLSADIAAIKAVVDTLQVSVNAHLVPSVPSEVYSAASAFRISLTLAIQDGETGALEDPDTFGNGQALISVKTVGGGSNPTLYDASSAGSALANNNQAGFTAWFNMNRTSQGQFEAWAEIPAYFNKSVQVQFLCFDSDPLAAQQTFSTTRFMVVRSPIQASFGGGAF